MEEKEKEMEKEEEVAAAAVQEVAMEEVDQPDEGVQEVAPQEVVQPHADVQDVISPNAEVPSQLVDPHPRTLQQLHHLVAQEEEHLHQPSPPPIPDIEKIKFGGSLPAPESSRELTLQQKVAAAPKPTLFSHKFFKGKTAAKPEKAEWSERVHVPKFSLESLT